MFITNFNNFNNLELIRITTLDDPLFKDAWNIYQESFPDHEKRLLKSQQEIISNPLYYFMVLTISNRVLGIALMWKTKTFTYIEHLAIAKEQRKKKLGTYLLEKIKTKNQPIILEIDPPLDSVSQKRLSFYNKNGFVSHEFNHIHPPYKALYCGHSLIILSYPNKIDTKTYSEFNHFLTEVIMKNAY